MNFTCAQVKLLRPLQNCKTSGDLATLPGQLDQLDSKFILVDF